MVFRVVTSKHAVLDGGEQSIAKPLPAGHPTNDRVVLEQTRADDHIGVTVNDRLSHLSDQRRVVLAVRVHHHDDVRAVERRPHVAGLLVRAVTAV